MPEMSREEFQLKQKELEIEEEKQRHAYKLAEMAKDLELKKDMMKFEHDLQLADTEARRKFQVEERIFWAERLLPVLNSFGSGMLASVHALCEVQKAWVQAQVDLEGTRMETIVNAIRAAMPHVPSVPPPTNGRSRRA